MSKFYKSTPGQRLIGLIMTRSQSSLTLYIFTLLISHCLSLSVDEDETAKENKVGRNGKVRKYYDRYIFIFQNYIITVLLS